MKKRVLLVLCLGLCLLLAACSPSAEQREGAEGGILLGYSQLGSESQWRIGCSKDIQDAAERAGVRLMFENAEQKQEKQISAIRSFIAYQVDVIALSPIVEDGWDHVLAEARAAGIPVLLVDRTIETADESLYAGFIGGDFLEEGRKAARFLLEKAQDKDLVRIAEIAGTPDSAPMLKRALGFREVLGDDPRYQIVASLNGDFLRSKGKECMRELLKQSTEMDVLYCHNDDMAMGAIEVMEENGIRPGKDVVIITVDGSQQAIDMLKAGKINCVVECTPKMGDGVMRLAEMLAAGEAIPRITYNEETVFSEFDDTAAITDRGY